MNTNITATTTFAGAGEQRQRELRASASAAYRRRNFSPERVAEAIVRAVEHDTAVVPVTPEAKVTYFAARVAPALLRRGARVDTTKFRGGRG